MVDVTRMPENAFGYVPTPALVAPIEFTLQLDDYAALGGHWIMSVRCRRIVDSEGRRRSHVAALPPTIRWPLATRAGHARPVNERARRRFDCLPDGRRLHLHDGPIDLVIEAFGDADAVEAAYAAAATRFVDCAG